MGWAKGFETKVINDKQTHFDEIFELAFVGISGSGGMEFTKHLALGNKKDVVAETNSTVTKGLSDVTFPGTALAHNEHAYLFVHKSAGGQVNNKCFVYGRVEGKVKFFKSLLISESCPALVSLFSF